jgi:4-hydroxybenzoate polyprenyltransferase
MRDTFLKRFNVYQKERFPFVVLLSTTIAVALSSSTVTGENTDWEKIIAASIIGLAYLFHIRVIDEIRDRDHDIIYYPNRPIPRGIISLSELKLMDWCAMGIIIFIAIESNALAASLASLCLIYSFFASKEFFLEAKIKSKFFFYNAINLLQMIFLQFLVYSLFFPEWYEITIVWIHWLFIVANIILLEVLRKIKIAKEESLGKDTYSWHLGFKRSLFFFLVISLLSYATFLWLFVTIKTSFIMLSISGGAMILLLLSEAIHYHKQSKKTEKKLHLATLITYITLNLLLYF